MSWAQKVEEASTVEAKLAVLADALDWLTHPRMQPAPAAVKTERMRKMADRHVESVDVRRVFEHWVRTMSRPITVKLTPERRQKIQQRLRDGYTASDMIKAIDGCAGSDFHMARGEYRGGKKYDDLTLILRNGSKLEWFRDMKNSEPDPDAFLTA